MSKREPETVAGLSVAHLATGWSVVHAGSGLQAVTGLRQRRFAEDARAELLATGVDFTREPKAIQADRERWRAVYQRWRARAHSRNLDPVTFEYYGEHVSFGQLVPSEADAATYRALAAELAANGPAAVDGVPGKGMAFLRELVELGLVLREPGHGIRWVGKVAA